MVTSQSTNINHISIRRAQPTDAEFAYQAQLTMKEYVEATWGSWSESAGRQRAAADANSGRSQIIEWDGSPAGLLCVDRFETHLQLDQLYIVPKYQNRGIGVHVLGVVLADARAAGLAARLRVLRVNPAKKFYESHGFKVEAETPERFFLSSQ